MALSNRLSLAGTDVNGIFYRVEIKYTGSTSITGKFALPMFKITSRPKDESINNWLITSKCDIYLYEDSDEISDFLTELIDYQQLDYYVYISTSVDDSTYTPYWRGIILQDQIQKEEASRPFVVKLTATDGLSLLKDIEYTTGNTVTGRTKLNDLLRQALLFGVDPLLWADDDVYFITTINWWESNQSYGATSDPLESLYLDASIYPISEQVFSQYVVTGYKSCYYVLEQILKVMGARLYMADGAYYIEQASERVNANTKRIKYDKSGTELSAGLIPSQIVIDETRGKARFAGNVYSFFPAIKKVIAKQNYYPYEGLNAFQYFPAGDHSAVVIKDWGLFDKDIDFAGSTAGNFFGMEVEFDMIIQWYLTSPKTDIIWWYSIEVEIKLDDVNSATNYYWDDDAGVWATTATTFSMNAQPAGILSSSGGLGTSIWHSVPFDWSITTDILPATGRVQVSVGGINVFYRQSNGVGGVQNINSWTLSRSGGVKFRLSEYSDRGGGFVNNEAVNTNPNIGDEYIVDLGDLDLGTGAKTTGNILAYDGTDTHKATNWDRANGSSNLSLGGLLVSERLRIQSEVLKVYDGVIQYPNGFAYSVLFNSERYLPISYSFNAYKSEVNGRYFLIGRDDSVTIDIDRGQGLLRNSFPNSINKFNKGNFLGNVLNAGEVIGYHEYLALSTSTLNLSYMTQGQKNNGLEVDASAGATATLSITDTVVLLTWAGGNGTFTLELPAADTMDLQRLEIILDSTFDTNKIVEITPASGLIRGASELELVSPEVKVQLRSIGDEWH